jgi:hypothetical protein
MLVAMEQNSGDPIPKQHSLNEFVVEHYDQDPFLQIQGSSRMARDSGSRHWDPLGMAIPFLNNISYMILLLNIMIKILSCSSRASIGGPGRAGPPPGSLRRGDSIPKQCLFMDLWNIVIKILFLQVKDGK